MTVGRLTMRGRVFQARVFAPFALAGGAGGGSIPTYTKRLILIGSSSERFSLEGTSSQSISLEGTSSQSLSILGSSL